MQTREEFEEQVRSLGLPLADGDGLSVVEKVYLLAEVCAAEAFEFPGMFVVSLLAVVHLHHQGLLSCGEASSSEDCERRRLWDCWCQSAERRVAEAHLMGGRSGEA